MRATSKRFFYLATLLLLGGCEFSSDSDLRSYISEVKARPAGAIEPLPTFRPFEAFVYSAARLRSPFELPVDVERRIYAQSSTNVKPDFNREKEYLEGFDLNSLKMVGTLKKGGLLWALVEDDAGMINWVTNGNFIGKNHGKIVETTETKIEIIEIVSDGLDGWVERPSVLALSEKE